MRRALLVATLAVAGIAAPTVACPVCSTSTGEQVRAGIVEDLGVSVAAVTLPPVLIAGLAAYVFFGGRSRHDD